MRAASGNGKCKTLPRTSLPLCWVTTRAARRNLLQCSEEVLGKLDEEQQQDNVEAWPRAHAVAGEEWRACVEGWVARQRSQVLPLAFTVFLP